MRRQQTDDKRYIFHEIEIQPEEVDIDDKPKLSEVIELIKVYKHVKNDSKYTKIRHLLPTFQYSVLIDEMPSIIDNALSMSTSNPIETLHRPRTVRLYFDTMPIRPNKLQTRLQPAHQAIDGIGLDVLRGGNEALTVDPFEVESSPTKGSSDFLRCFFIPYLTKHNVFSKVLLHEQQQKHKTYQSQQNIFSVTSDESMKFFLSPYKILKPITENLLIAGFAKHCPRENIIKNGEPLTRKQREQIQKLENAVDQMRMQCGQIINLQERAPPNLDILYPIGREQLTIHDSDEERQTSDLQFLQERKSTSNIGPLLSPLSIQSDPQALSVHRRPQSSFRNAFNRNYQKYFKKKNTTDSNKNPESIPPTIARLTQKKLSLQMAKALKYEPDRIACLQKQIKELSQKLQRQPNA